MEEKTDINEKIATKGGISRGEFLGLLAKVVGPAVILAVCQIDPEQVAVEDVKATAASREVSPGEDEVERNLPEVARTNSIEIEANSSRGSGVVYYQGYSEKVGKHIAVIITSKHISRGAGLLMIDQPQMDQRTVTKRNYGSKEFQSFPAQEGVDVVVLQSDQKMEIFPYAQDIMVSKSDPEIGDKLYSLTFPKGSDRGFVSGLTIVEGTEEQKIAQPINEWGDATTASGSSGGGWFDEAGVLSGIHRGMWDEGNMERGLISIYPYLKRAIEGQGLPDISKGVNDYYGITIDVDQRAR